MVSLEAEPRTSRLHTGCTISLLMGDPDGRMILSKYIGGFLLMEDMSMAGDMTLEQVSANHPNFVSAETLGKIEKELVEIS